MTMTLLLLMMMFMMMIRPFCSLSRVMIHVIFKSTDRFPTRDQRPSVSFVIILAMSGSSVLQPEQNNYGHAHDGLHSCISRTRNICDVSATYRTVAWHMQRTCGSSAYSLCATPLREPYSLCATPCHHTHMHTHRHMPLLLHDPASDHSRSLHMSVITPPHVYTPCLA